MNFLRDIKLLFQWPVEFIYTFTYPTDKKPEIEPYNPATTKTARELIEKIEKECPGLQIVWIGSAALEISGQRDIDIYCGCDPKNFPQYLPSLIALFKKPEKIKKQFIEWHFNYETCNVDLLLIDPNSRKFREPIHRFNVLKNHPEVKMEYENLKSSSQNISMREYEKRKLQFFGKISKIKA